MSALSETERLVLNEMFDDAENLEQIYRSLSFEPAGEPIGLKVAGCWRDAEPHMSLMEIADAIRSLVKRDLLIVRHDPAEPSSNNDLSYVWRCWFEPTDEARELCSVATQTRHNRS